MFWHCHWLLSRLETDPHADVASETPGKGRKLEFVDCTEQAKIIFHSLESGNTISTSTILLNEYFWKPPTLKYRRIQPWLIDHVISESTRLYAGFEHADTFQIFHDGLTARGTILPCREGVQGSPTAQSRPNNQGTRYEGKLLDDAPEICRGLDSFGVEHLSHSVRLHTALTSILVADDPLRF
jgi:hypothetical protein